MEYVDLASGETNGAITIGTIGTINGHHRKFNPAAADEDVFLIDPTGIETKIMAIQKNKPTQLIFLVQTTISPIVPVNLEVRARLGDDTSELRTGRLDVALTGA